MPRPLRLMLLLLVVAAAGVGAYFAYEHFRATGPDHVVGPGPDKPRGRLVVLVVFDQMRGDYVAKWAEHFGPDGFERLKKDGVWYADVQIPYACTATGPGHASLVTGAPPSAHGIVENEWYDRKVGR